MDVIIFLKEVRVTRPQTVCQIFFLFQFYISTKWCGSMTGKQAYQEMVLNNLIGIDSTQQDAFYLRDFSVSITCW